MRSWQAGRGGLRALHALWVDPVPTFMLDTGVGGAGRP